MPRFIILWPAFRILRVFFVFFLLEQSIVFVARRCAPKDLPATPSPLNKSAVTLLSKPPHARQAVNFDQSDATFVSGPVPVQIKVCMQSVERSRADGYSVIVIRCLEGFDPLSRVYASYFTG